MKTLFTKLGFLLLILSFATKAQQNKYQQEVSFQYEKVPMKVILEDISQKYHLLFTYSASNIDVNKSVSIQLKKVMLADGLDYLLKTNGIQWTIVGEQVVLTKYVNVVVEKIQDKSNTPKYSQIQFKPVDIETLWASQTLYIEKDSNRVIPYQEARLIMNEKEHDTLSIKEIKKSYKHEKKKLKYLYKHLKDSAKIKDAAIYEKLQMKYNYIEQLLKTEFQNILDSTHLNKEKLIPSIGTQRGDMLDSTQIDSVGFERKLYQISVVPPLSTNGPENKNCVNQYSFNIFAGYSAGVEGIELGSWVNVNRNYMSGVQMAGISNVVFGKVNGVQFAGVSNTNKGMTKGILYAGTLNTTLGGMNGVQFAGVLNVNYGELKGTQVGGVLNTNIGNCDGGQVAGVININTGKMKGTQVSGVLNINADTLKGGQIAGVLNVAKTVYGTQIGLLNFSDSIAGVPIGLLSFSRKGYKRIDLYGGETMYSTVAFRTGAKQFHNILLLNARIDKGITYWGFGYGIGSELHLSKRISINLDATASHINKEEWFTNDLNLLSQAHIGLGIITSPKSMLYFGPTFNVFNSTYINDDGTVGMAIAPNSFLNNTFNTNSSRHPQSNVKAWVGVRAGFRF